MSPTVRPTAAFFDLDKTIIAKSSTLAFSREFQQGGLISRGAVLRSAYAQFVYLVGGADHDQMEKMRQFMSQLCVGWDVQTVNEIVADTLHNIVDPLVYDEAVGLIEEHHARRPRRRDRLHQRLGGRRADRRDARRRPRGRHADGGRGRPVHRRDQLLRLRRGQGRTRSGSWPRSAATTSTAATPTATRSPTCPCSRPSATPTRSTPTRTCARIARDRAGRSWSSTSRSRCAAGCGCHRRDRRWRRSPIGGVTAIGAAVWLNVQAQRATRPECQGLRCLRIGVHRSRQLHRPHTEPEPTRRSTLPTGRWSSPGLSGGHS